MKVTVLGSGSSGNATLIEAGDVRILIDAGFSGRDIERRLRAIDVEPGSITALVITHDHGDHTRGMGVLARRFGLPLFLTDRTRVACAALLNGSEDVRSYSSSTPFTIGTLEVRPFLTVHDAADPVAVTVRNTETGARLGIATDLGRPTMAVRAELAGCHMLVLEANHDDARLWTGPYPWSVKQRIASSHGHMSNRAAAELARELCHDGLRTIVLAHLSTHCNDAALAHDVVGSALARLRYRGSLAVAPQDEPMAPVNVTSSPEQLTLLL
ncbi:MBL fold metallo-hydrolase [soil metagenome]